MTWSSTWRDHRANHLEKSQTREPAGHYRSGMQQIFQLPCLVPQKSQDKVSLPKNPDTQEILTSADSKPQWHKSPRVVFCSAANSALNMVQRRSQQRQCCMSRFSSDPHPCCVDWNMTGVIVWLQLEKVNENDCKQCSSVISNEVMNESSYTEFE